MVSFNNSKSSIIVVLNKVTVPFVKDLTFSISEDFFNCAFTTKGVAKMSINAINKPFFIIMSLIRVGRNFFALPAPKRTVITYKRSV